MIQPHRPDRIGTNPLTKKGIFVNVELPHLTEPFRLIEGLLKMKETYLIGHTDCLASSASSLEL